MDEQTLKINPTATISQAGLQASLDNFDEANIADIKRAWAEEESTNSVLCNAYTMVQTNSSCDVKITNESIKAWAKALLR